MVLKQLLMPKNLWTLLNLPRKKHSRLGLATALVAPRCYSVNLMRPKIIYAKIEEARAKGYAVSVEETTIGELVVGAAILDGDGQPIAAIQIAASTSDWRPADFEKKFAPLTIETAQTLSRTSWSMHQ